MGLDDVPEIKLARRIISKHLLKVPFDIETLIQEYAILIYRAIPLEGVDGVSLNIKVPGKKPSIIVNTNQSHKRQLFTLAHELGHLIIPWHLGTIVDNIYPKAYKNNHYLELEREANKFAAELLMPKDWMLNEIKNCDTELADLHKRVARRARVSDQAAAIRLIDFLPQNIVYVAEEYGLVQHSGKSGQTRAYLPEAGSRFNDGLFPYVDEYSNHQEVYVQYHWWKLSSTVNIEVEDDRPWREILNDIVEDIRPGQDNVGFKKSISSITAAAHGTAKRQSNYSVESVIAATLYSLRRPELKSFVDHPEFENFVIARSKEFFNTAKHK
jgi:Zn-dependent peptidase ImmA (M78 family)